MRPILRLFVKAADAAVDVARTSIELVASAVQIAIADVRERRDGQARTVPPPPPPPHAAARPARTPRPAPPQPFPVRPERAAPPPEEPAAITVVREPTRGEAARIREQQREAEQTDDSPGPEIRVDEPWPGYKSMNAPEIVDRVAAADEATKAVVLLYERGHRKRKTVLRAAGGH
jgi:hypothetical protein